MAKKFLFRVVALLVVPCLVLSEVEGLAADYTTATSLRHIVDVDPASKPTAIQATINTAALQETATCFRSFMRHPLIGRLRRLAQPVRFVRPVGPEALFGPVLLQDDAAMTSGHGPEAPFAIMTAARRQVARKLLLSSS